MAVGHYRADSVPASVTAAFPEISEALAQRTTTAEPAVETAVAAAATRLTGSLTVRFKDFAQIVLNSTTAQVTYTNGSCVNSPQANLYNGWSWYTPTGWYRESNSTDNLRNCSTARALTKAVYRNATFCGALAQITAEHKKTHFEGLTNGRWSWLKVTDKGGICASAITEQVVVVTP